MRSSFQSILTLLRNKYGATCIKEPTIQRNTARVRFLKTGNVKITYNVKSNVDDMEQICKTVCYHIDHYGTWFMNTMETQEQPVVSMHSTN